MSSSKVLKLIKDKEIESVEFKQSTKANKRQGN